MRLQDLTYEEVEEYLNKKDSIIIPLGAIEQHGPSMPLGTDKIIAELFSNEVSKKSGVVVGPTLAPGISIQPHMNFKGTITFMSNTFESMIKDYIRSLHKHGFRKFLLINGHGGNDGAIKNAMTEICYELNDIIYDTVNWWRMPDIASLVKEELGHPVGHACASEAALVMIYDAKLVKKDKFVSEFPKESFKTSTNLASKFLTKTGVIGADQSKANVALGTKIFDMGVNNYLELLKNMEKY